MTRSLWKGPFLSSSFLKGSKKNHSKIWARKSVIPSFLIGQTVLVHNGNVFKKFLITREKVGFKFGEFAFTRASMNKIKKNKTLTKKKK